MLIYSDVFVITDFKIQSNRSVPKSPFKRRKKPKVL